MPNGKLVRAPRLSDRRLTASGILASCGDGRYIVGTTRDAHVWRWINMPMGACRGSSPSTLADDDNALGTADPEVSRKLRFVLRQVARRHTADVSSS